MEPTHTDSLDREGRGKTRHGSEYRERLISDGYLMRMDDGLLGRGAKFERIISAVEAAITQIGAADEAEVLSFPPVVPGSTILNSGYMRNFAPLAGGVHCFCGGDARFEAILHDLRDEQEWLGHMEPVNLFVTPAACYPVYAAFSDRGPLPPSGATVDVCSYCFRREPSADPFRMQAFRMRENVRLGSSDQVDEFCRTWRLRLERIFGLFELPFSVSPASDPFFGRPGVMLQRKQSAAQTKLEVVVDMDGHEVACASLNRHGEHFSHIWELRTATGEFAETACVAFGLERIVLALLYVHGGEISDWPAGLRENVLAS